MGRALPFLVVGRVGCGPLEIEFVAVALCGPQGTAEAVPGGERP